MLLQKTNIDEMAKIEPKQLITQSVDHVKTNWLTWVIVLFAGYWFYPKNNSKSYRKPSFKRK